MDEILEHLKRGDARLGELIERVGPCGLSRKPAEFQTLAGAVLAQQLSSKAASTIQGRLVAALGGRLAPEGLLELTVEELRGLGLSRPKAGYLLGLAQMTVARELDFEALPELSDQEVIRHLTRAKGVGEWTAQMFLMFALGRLDVLPVADLGIRNAMQRLYRMKKPPAPERMERVARPWRPYATVACWYLWRSLEGPAEL